MQHSSGCSPYSDVVLWMPLIALCVGVSTTHTHTLATVTILDASDVWMAAESGSRIFLCHHLDNLLLLKLYIWAC